MWPNPQETVDLVTFTEGILNHFLCSDLYSVMIDYEKNWLCGKLSSIIVSETISISILPLNLFFSNSNLFLMEFMFKWANIKLLTLPLRIDFTVLSQKLSCSASNNTSELHSLKFRLKLVLNSQLKTLEISLIKVLLETSSRIILA